MARSVTILCGLALLAGCAAVDLSEPRAQALMALPGPEHYGERFVARELAGRCAAYSYDEPLAEAMTRERVKARQPTSIEIRGASEVAADVRRRSLLARYGGGASWSGIDACAVLDAETARGAPMTALTRRRG